MDLDRKLLWCKHACYFYFFGEVTNFVKVEIARIARSAKYPILKESTKFAEFAKINEVAEFVDTN